MAQTITRALNIVKIHVVATKMRIQKHDLNSFLKRTIWRLSRGLAAVAYQERG